MESKKRAATRSKEWLAANRELRVELAAAGLTDEDDRRALYQAYSGKATAAEMTSAEIRSIAGDLRRVRQGAESKLEVMRKRVIAAVCEFLEGNDAKFGAMNRAGRLARAKAVAARAAQAQDFNKISEARLRGIYNAFKKMNEASRQAVEVGMKAITGEI